MEVSYLFAGIGAIILLGFLGSLLFERTKVPDILILIFMGLVLGPILTQYTNFGLLDDPEMSSALTTIAPYFAALALVIILFDGGLNLNLEKTMQKLGLAILHTGLAFIGTMVVTAIVCFYLLNMEIIIGLLLGCILGGVSSAVVIPIMSKASAREDTKVLLTLESVLTDVLCIVTALVLIEILKGSNMETGALIQQLLSAFVLAGFIAFLFGILWLAILKKLEGKPFAFMITIAALFVLYAFTEYIGVSGAIAALVFGLVLSNKEEIARILKIKGSFVLDENIKQFHSEVSFLIRTFFFVYLGITFTFSIGADTFGTVAWFVPDFIRQQPIMIFLMLLAILFTGIFVVRYVTSSITCAVNKEAKEDKSYLYSMLPRGLAAAVLAQLPFTIKEFSNPAYVIPEYVDTISSYQSVFLNTAFMMIVITVVATTVGVSIIERGRANAANSKAVELKEDDWASKSKMYKKQVQGSSDADWAKVPVAKKPTPPPKQTPKAAVPAQTKTATKPVKGAPAPQKTPVKKETVQRKAPPPPKDHPLVKRADASKTATPHKTQAKKKTK